MRRRPYNRHPLAPAFALGLAVFAGLLVALFLLDAISYAHRRIGIGQGAMFSLLWLSLLGGFVNIPLARLRGRQTTEVSEITVFGVRYRVPVVRRQPGTILAVNLGGAVIPTALSLYLLVNDRVWWQAAVAVASSPCSCMPSPGRYGGWGSPCPHSSAAPGGRCRDPLVRARPRSSGLHRWDPRHVDRSRSAQPGELRELEAGVASIGGAGTFDGVFLSGIIAVLLVAVR